MRRIISSISKTAHAACLLIEDFVVGRLPMHLQILWNTKMAERAFDSYKAYDQALIRVADVLPSADANIAEMMRTLRTNWAKLNRDARAAAIASVKEAIAARDTFKWALDVKRAGNELDYAFSQARCRHMQHAVCSR